MTFIAGYAYPTSAHAAECQMSDTGCFIVTRDHNIKTGARLKRPVLAMGPFATKADALKWIKGWQPYNTKERPGLIAEVFEPLIKTGLVTKMPDGSYRGNPTVEFSTELTPIGEQFVIPGAERQTTKKHPQGELF